MTDQSHSSEEQFGFDLGEKPASRTYEPNRDEIRQDLADVLQAARAVTPETLWDERTFRYNKVVYPQMARWLPDEEREQFCFEFFREIERIQLLLAA